MRILLRLERLIHRVRLRFLLRQGKNALPADLDRPLDRAGWEAIVLPAPVKPVTALSTPAAREIAEATAPGDALLEAGCGLGNISAELAVAGREIYLVDFSQKILDRAVRLFEASKLPRPYTKACDITEPLPYADGAVDTVWSSGVLEHWDDDQILAILREMKRISRKSVIALVPYAGSILYRFGKYMAETYGIWQYGLEMPRATLEPLFNAAGLKNIREKTLWAELGPCVVKIADPPMGEMVVRWWESLPEDDPVRVNQGYLLMTIGDC